MAVCNFINQPCHPPKEIDCNLIQEGEKQFNVLLPSFNYKVVINDMDIRLFRMCLRNYANATVQFLGLAYELSSHDYPRYLSLTEWFPCAQTNVRFHSEFT